jgi:hypothetical protein
VRDFHERGMTLEGGDELLGDLAARLSLAGRPDACADAIRATASAPTIASRTTASRPRSSTYGRCLLDWGHFARAAEVIGCYLDAYVSQ